MVIVAGTGALGTLLAARLAVQEDVTVLGTWPAALEALAASGAVVESEGGRLEGRVRATADPAACAGARLAFVAVKAPATARVAAALSLALAPDGAAVTLQNGLGNVETLEAALGPDRVVAGVAEVGATLLAPGRVRDGGGARVRIAAHPRARAVVDLLRRAGFDVRVEADAVSLLWEKLAAAAPILPLTALLDVPNGALLRTPSAGALLEEAAREVDAVARALHIPLPTGAVEAARRVAGATLANLSSMLQDVRRGVPTEIDAINGAVVRAGERAGVPTPVNRVLLRLVRALGERDGA